MSFNLNDAFRKLDELNEDIFTADDTGITAMKDTLDDVDETEVVYDMEASTPEELKKSYVGKLVLGCPICMSLMYKDQSEITVDEETGKANLQEECPVCMSTEGFYIVGKIEPECCEAEITNPEVSENPEETPVVEEGLKKDKRTINEAVGTIKDQVLKVLDYNGFDTEHPEVIEYADSAAEYIEDRRNSSDGYYSVNQWYRETEKNYPEELEELRQLQEGCDGKKRMVEKDEYSKADEADLYELMSFVLYDGGQDAYKKNEKGDTIPVKPSRAYTSDQAGVGPDDTITIISDSKEDLATAEKTAKKYGAEFRYIPEGKRWKIVVDPWTVSNIDALIADARKQYIDLDSINESLDSVKVEADGKQVEVKPEDRKTVVEISNSGCDNEECAEEGEEVITPVDESDLDFEEEEVTEFDEDSFDEVQESYLNEVYENVKSYKTTNVREDGNKLVVEGVITFNSNKEVPTQFMLEHCGETKSGKIRLRGFNERMSKSKNAFKVLGTLNNGKLITESLTYNYAVKNEKGLTEKLHGRVHR